MEIQKNHKIVIVGFIIVGILLISSYYFLYYPIVPQWEKTRVQEIDHYPCCLLSYNNKYEVLLKNGIEVISKDSTNYKFEYDQLEIVIINDTSYIHIDILENYIPKGQTVDFVYFIKSEINLFQFLTKK